MHLLSYFCFTELEKNTCETFTEAPKKSVTFLNVTDFIFLNTSSLLLLTFLNSFAFQPLPSFPAFCVENGSWFWVWFYFPESEREFSVRQ